MKYPRQSELLCRILVACLSLLITPQPKAQLSDPSSVYEYVGNAFQVFSTPSSYTSKDVVTATLTVNDPLPPNLEQQDVSDRPGFRLVMNDGHQTLAAGSGVPFEAKISTDSQGQIVGPWSLIINCCGYPNNGIATLNSPDGRGIGDSGFLSAPSGAFPETPYNYGENFGTPGTWSVVPEPVSTNILVASALLMFGLMYSRSRRTKKLSLVSRCPFRKWDPLALQKSAMSRTTSCKSTVPGGRASIRASSNRGAGEPDPDHFHAGYQGRTRDALIMASGPSLVSSNSKLTSEPDEPQFFSVFLDPKRSETNGVLDW